MKRVKKSAVVELHHMMGKFPRAYPSLIEYIAIVQEIDDYVKRLELRQLLGEAIRQYKRSENVYPRNIRNAARLLWNPQNGHQDIVKSYNHLRVFGGVMSFWGDANPPRKNWTQFREFITYAAGSMILLEVLDCD